ncbi:hypothetical protein M422DRAFT_276442 [Sphaerobolus stellatus SS14]|uniref:Uncharacterized protein n=1 Tax=Sphaerobolus stellatus (strain SS14) TaxID=990650 RepID=A0A0C9U1Y6_SPHS4|nr:hypothetical protein M422DRAFT_276442 [Sphaerobolus stellatus SS14]
MEDRTNHSDSSLYSSPRPFEESFMIFSRPGYQRSPPLVDSQPPPSNQAALSPHIRDQSSPGFSGVDYPSQPQSQIPYWKPGYVDTQTRNQMPNEATSRRSGSLHRILNSPLPSTPSSGEPSPAASPLADRSVNTNGEEGSEGETNIKKRMPFTGPELLQLAIAVVDVNPWLAGYGEKTKKWNEVASRVRNHSAKFRRLNRQTDTYKRKMDALIQWHKNGPDGASTIVEKEAMSGTDVRISIGALLDKAGTLRDNAAMVNEENKEKARALQDENKAAGESIRRNAMKKMKRRHESEESEKENISSDSPLNLQVKHVRRSDSNGRLDDIKGLMVQDMQQRREDNMKMMQETETFHSRLLDLFERKL